MPAFEFSGGHNGWVKECSRCKKIHVTDTKNQKEAEKILSEFFAIDSSNRRADGLNPWCRNCMALKNRATRQGRKCNPEEILMVQDGKCAICQVEISLKVDQRHRTCIDHNHATNKVRGLLCNRCNVLMAGVDDEEWLKKAIVYRDSFQ